jgi:hypothetical protein
MNLKEIHELQPNLLQRSCKDSPTAHSNDHRVSREHRLNPTLIIESSAKTKKSIPRENTISESAPSEMARD